MSDETRRCPNCGSICGKSDLFCNKCGAKLPQEPPKCPVCGREYKPGEDLYCNKCGTKLPSGTGGNSDNKKRVCPICDTPYGETDKVCKTCGADLTLINPGLNKTLKRSLSCDEKPLKAKQPSMIALLIFVFCLVLFGSMALLHSFVPDAGDVNLPDKNLDGEEVKRDAKPCDDEEVKNMLLEAYKEKSDFVNDIASSSINYMTVKSPVTVEFESSQNRYLCEATIVMESLKGFRPSDYNESNKFFTMVQTNVPTDDGVGQIRNASKIKCDVKYSSEMRDGRLTVKTSACGGNGEEFVWDRYKEYVEIPGEREKLQKEKDEEAKKLEEERLAEERKIKEEEERKAKEEERKAQEALKKQQEEAKRARDEELKRLEAERKRLEEWQKKQEAINKQTDDVFKTIMPAGHTDNAE